MNSTYTESLDVLGCCSSLVIGGDVCYVLITVS